jgi:hypothetical protein
MRAHRGIVGVGDNSGGGALFSLSFAMINSQEPKTTGKDTKTAGGG